LNIHFCRDQLGRADVSAAQAIHDAMFANARVLVGGVVNPVEYGFAVAGSGRG
jgi:hypothetical protein